MKRVARDLNPLPVMKIRTVVGHVQTVHRCRVFGDGGHELREDKIGCFPSTKGRGTASVTFVSGARALVEGAARMRITAPPLSSTSARERCCPRTRIDRLLPQWNPGTRKVVGAAGFEPAAPCAQGKPERAIEVLISERFAASENSWAHFWDHPFGDASLMVVNGGEHAARVVAVWIALSCRRVTTTIDNISNIDTPLTLPRDVVAASARRSRCLSVRPQS